MESQNHCSSSLHFSKRSQNSVTMPHLPNEIILEILSLLPVKSLMRFKCVCKSWRLMISDPEFAKKQLNVATKESGKLDNLRLILHSPYLRIKSCSLPSLFYEPFGYSINHDYPGRDLGVINEIVGCYNGLVCISIRDMEKDTIFVWNPSIKESKRLPSKPFEQLFYLVSYAFGYDSITDDYKVVRLVCCSINDSYEYHVEVFSLRSNAWRKIRSFPYFLFTDEAGKHVNGSINWAVSRDKNNDHWFIASLDLATESYQVVPQPDCANETLKPIIRVLGGQFCIIFEYDDIIDVWVMQEYGVKESWSKLVTVPFFSDPLDANYAKPLFYLKEGAILIDFYGMLILYNFNRNESTSPMIYGVHHYHEVEVYLESMVSPNSYN